MLFCRSVFPLLCKEKWASLEAFLRLWPLLGSLSEIEGSRGGVTSDCLVESKLGKKVSEQIIFIFFIFVFHKVLVTVISNAYKTNIVPSDRLTFRLVTMFVVPNFRQLIGGAIFHTRLRCT